MIEGERKMFCMTKTLIVVYKDEMLVNQFKKLVETNDDINGDAAVGTRDGSINIVSWSEKIWLANKKAGNIKDKVLFLGDIKGTDKLIPVIDVKFNEHGVKFGWAGNQAAIFTDVKELNDRDDYLSFIKELSELPVPEIIKKAKNVKVVVSEEEGEKEETTVMVAEDDNKKRKIQLFFDKTKEKVVQVAENVGKTGIKAVAKTEDLLRNKNAVTTQMLFYGVVKLYENGLEEFMNA